MAMGLTIGTATKHQHLFYQVSYSAQIPLSPVTRTILPSPAFTSLIFSGAPKYLEDLVTQVDSPRPKGVPIRYFNRPVPRVTLNGLCAARIARWCRIGGTKGVSPLGHGLVSDAVIRIVHFAVSPSELILDECEQSEPDTSRPERGKCAALT
ncbi:hypothetical protein EDB89DRAFT_1489930 [Lactarius sanguifluus]|nr:hypothetical protein EDB89DRAFT_1489930 [Lactarius sanguifluus]